MITVIALGGAPGSGKSTITKKILSKLKEKETPEEFKHSLVRGLKFNNQQILVLGTYEEGEAFPGTDRLSMAVQPKAIELLEEMSADDSWIGWKVFFEGDRLSTATFFEKLKSISIPLIFFLLKASGTELEKRYKERGSNQSSKFLQGRHTKYANLEKKYLPQVLINESKEHIEENVDRIFKELL